MSLSPGLAVGIVLTIAGWLGLVVAVVHSRRTIERLTAAPASGPDDEGR